MGGSVTDPLPPAAMELILRFKSEANGAYSQGIFSLSKIGHNIFSRGLKNPVDQVQAQATEAAGAVGDTIGNAATVVAQATRVAADVKDKAESAIAAAETLVSGAIPKSFS
ncbi:hypothetical protein CDV31_016666, partial [Fusarium ambrosium]